MTEATATPARVASSRKRWLHVIAWVLCIAIVVIVVRALLQQLGKVEWSQVHFDPAWTAAAFVCVLGVSIVQLIARWTLLNAYGYPLDWRVQAGISWVSQLGKYVPGGVISVGGSMLLLKRYGIPGAVALSVSVLIDALAVTAGLIVSTPLLMTESVRSKYPTAWVASVIITLVGLVMLYPPVFVGALNIVLRKAKRQPIAQVPPVRKYVWPVLASFAQWVMAGLGLWCMAAAVTAVSVNTIPLFIASAALAMTASYLAPFSPGGAGIREGLYLITLSPILRSAPNAAIIAVAMRVIQTVIELLLAAIGAALMRHERRVNPASAAQR